MNVEAEKAWIRIKQKNDVLDRLAVMISDFSSRLTYCPIDKDSISVMEDELGAMKLYILWAKGL